MDHECNFWRHPDGALVCACGKSKRPIELTDKQQETVARFGVWDEETGDTK